MIETIHDAHQWLARQTSHQLRPGFERMRQALAWLGHAERQLPPIIHLAGTNGKGSTLALLQGALLSQGLRVGAFSSPHILAFNERIMLNGQPIGDEDLLGLVQEMAALNERLAQTEWGPLSGFELYTVMMIQAFSQLPLDVCLVEAGVGGRWDCTNILDAQVALITTIGLDHQDRLGQSLTAIAQQKFGIIKPQTQDILVGDLPAEAWAGLPDSVPVPVQVLGRDYTVTGRQTRGLASQEWRVTLPSGQVLDAVTIGLLGRHQGNNLALALASFEAWMNLQGRAIDWTGARTALAQVRWQGRLERLSDQPLILIDGAHNAQGLEALGDFIRQDLADYAVTLVFAGLKRKDQAQHLATLTALDQAGVQVRLATFDYPGAMTATEWAALAGDWPVVDWQALVDDWRGQGRDGHRALILTGSLYFVSQVKEYFM